MNLILFNFELNKNSQALSFSIDWVNEIAKNVNKLYVVSLRCGEYNVANNVEVYCLYKDKKNRFQTVLSIWKVLKYIHEKDKNVSGYFVHMAYYFVPILYPFAKIFNQKIVLWYAHKSVPFNLKITNFLVDKVLTSTSIGYQIKTPKLRIIGQGIDCEKFRIQKIPRKYVKNIVTIGRISKIKNIDTIVNAFLSLKRNDIYLYVVGDVLVKGDTDYLKKIKMSIPHEYKKNIIFTGSIPYNELPKIYQDIDLSINMSETGSLDKAIIESMAMGIPVITLNESAKKLFFHLDEKGIFLCANKVALPKILQEVIEKNQNVNKKQLREEIIQNHSLNKLAQKIVSEYQ